MNAAVLTIGVTVLAPIDAAPAPSASAAITPPPALARPAERPQLDDADPCALWIGQPPEACGPQRK